MSVALRCASCGEPIGVYEPLVRVLDGRARESSRLREPQLTGRDGDCFHSACYERLEDAEGVAE